MSRPYTKETLIAKTNVTKNGCMEWAGLKNSDGYGRTLRYGKGTTTHRLSYQLHFGEIPGGKQVLHKCDNPPCINPNHLWLGTHKENMEDMTSKGRRISLPGETNPAAKLTAIQVMAIRSLLDQGTYVKRIAQKFGVSMATIYHIKNGRIWRGYDDKLKEAGL